MATTVRISESSRKILSSLARESNTSMTAVLDSALETYRRHRFLAQAAAAYETLANDPVAKEDYRKEISDLDGTSVDGLDSYSL